MPLNVSLGRGLPEPGDVAVDESQVSPLSLGETRLWLGDWYSDSRRWGPAADLGTALAEGELTSEIILVTDFAPRNLPPLAGLIALSPSSPNSHAVLLMESSGRPFIDLPPSALVELTNLLGEQVVLTTLTKSQTAPVFSSSQPHLPPSWHSELFHLVKTDALPQGALEVLKGVGSPGQVNIPPVTRLGRHVEDAVNLAPGDAKYFGGKAAHFGVLRRVIPTNSPPAIAFSFDLWLDFLEQPMPAGGDAAGRDT